MNFESNNYMFNVKLRDLNAHLLDQKLLYETTQKYYISNFTSCVIILMFKLIYGDKCFNFGLFFACCYVTKLGKSRLVFCKQTNVTACRLKWNIAELKYWTSCRVILAWNQTCDYKSQSRCAVMRFCNHASDFGLNWITLSAITIINFCFLEKGRLRNLYSHCFTEADLKDFIRSATNLNQSGINIR